MLWRHVAWPAWRKVACGLGAYILGCVLGVVVTPLFRDLATPILVALTRLAATAFFTCLWWIVPAGRWRATMILFAAAGFGNTVCLLVPPHAVIDFMYSRLLSAVFQQGVFNIADLYFDIGVVCLVVFAGWAIVARLVSRIRERLAPAD